MRAGMVAALIAASAAPAWSAAKPVAVAGLHNVFQLDARLYSGSSPDGDPGFAALKALGVRTILSVDGARPDAARARAHGLRYVHLPIGYDGVPQAQAWRIARAVRDLPGPIYLHCHHGKHRGPAAAATALLCVDAEYSPAAARAFLAQAGTDPRYRGLWASPRTVRRPERAELDRLPLELPEVAPVAELARRMSELDETWDHLQAIRKAGWKVPASHPDLDPAHEALLLVEHFREAARGPELEPELRRGLLAAGSTARALEAALRESKEAEEPFQRVARSCTECHVVHRDPPR